MIQHVIKPSVILIMSYRRKRFKNKKVQFLSTEMSPCPHLWFIYIIHPLTSEVGYPTILDVSWNQVESRKPLSSEIWKAEKQSLLNKVYFHCPCFFNFMFSPISTTGQPQRLYKNFVNHCVNRSLLISISIHFPLKYPSKYVISHPISSHSISPFFSICNKTTKQQSACLAPPQAIIHSAPKTPSLPPRNPDHRAHPQADQSRRHEERNRRQKLPLKSGRDCQIVAHV